ncbi:DUF1254 domain-containing protein [Novosphingobium sp. YJ-S2-02]|uniref:DUF1254 domain-containing protein n=1 Tax=Novosphingobium aureum TaxID=2792964 RepID=A0A931MK17_9SPHN|nr:DUF1254 domain-containing protein [Novosphingobium aureum]MBH0111999.1 DUF1254 domain-containing protein [Novosphingobium aureum]
MKRIIRHLAGATLPLGLAMLVLPVASTAQQVPAGQRAYDPDHADQFMWPEHADLLPPPGPARRDYARMLAYDARLFGTSAVLEYAQMFGQALDRGAKGYTGFNRFDHASNLARPGYGAFKTPNADTLYSNAWLDLTKGPVILEVPDAGDTYFAANFIDMYGNSSNISTRTRGSGAGRYAIVPLGWDGGLPEGTERFTVTTPYCWILLRVLAKDLKNPVRARKVQDGFRLEAPQAEAITPIATDFPAPETDTLGGFMRILDWVVRNAGYPSTETALVHRYRMLGVGRGAEAVTQAIEAPDLGAGAEAGFASAGEMISDSARLSGYPAGTWKTPADTGAYGYNYLYRSAIHTLGTGANVGIENYPFNTFVDADGEALDGAAHDYRMTFTSPPPARYFWSLTLYDAKTRELSPNPIARYLINDRTPGLKRNADGSLTIDIQHKPPQGGTSNWLPAPDGPFYLVIRAQGPEAPLLSGEWLPPAVRKEAAQ